MGLFSDIDWVIIAGVAGFLLFGRENGQMLRTLGRWYARAIHLKQDLLAEVTKAADLPVGMGAVPSLRSALLGLDAPLPRSSGIPAAVTAPPAATIVPPAPNVPWTGGQPILTWSVTGVPAESEGFR